MFGNTEVWVAVIEWDESMDPSLIAEPTEEEAWSSIRSETVSYTHLRAHET